MCGIVGFIGKQNAVPFILSGLKNLEYRGYDSSGIAIKQNNLIISIKEVGELKNLEASLSNNAPDGNIGIGHTRWATHGEISKINAHPHISMNAKISIVHNGIIENYIELKSELENLGYIFLSTTDSEVIAHLIEYYLNQNNNILDAVFKAKNKLVGSYAIAILEQNSDRIIAVKNKSPLCIGIISPDEVMISSDPSSIYNYTNKFIFLNDGEIVSLDKNQNNIDISLYKEELSIPYKVSELNILEDNEDLKGYPNYMLKEIEEQPEIINHILESYLDNNGVFTKEDEVLSILTANTKDIWLIACGTSYFAGELCVSLLNKYSKANVFTCLASEFEPFAHKINENSVIITISQSGETADTLSVLKEVLLRGAKIISLTNASYSTISNLAHLNIDIKAKKERAVASTKAFSSSVIVLYLVFLSFLKSRQEISQNEYNTFIKDLKDIPKTTNIVINQLKAQIEKLAELLFKKEKAIFLGKYSNYIIAKEGALKLKEITYIHSEAIPAGELKHGPLALIEKDFPIISIFNNSENNESTNENKIISNILETKARGALNINITNFQTPNIENIGIYNLYLNTTSNISFSINSAVVLQYLSYFTANLRGVNIDKPRNLAKSVTVE